jgi:carboxylesterase type B
LNSAFQAIVVAPAYRLNAFGFLSGKELELEAQEKGEPVGNQGFWDQRLALEWVAEHIPAFGGNLNNVTVGGYSAGSHSTFQQLAHELYFVPDHKAIIKRAIMWSNSPGGKTISPAHCDKHQPTFSSATTYDGPTPSPVR